MQMILSFINIRRKWIISLCLLAVLAGILLSTRLIAGAAELPQRPERPSVADPASGQSVSLHMRGRFAADWPFADIHWQEDLWLGVQWLDGVGVWHNISGWQGSFDQINYFDQWIAQKDYWADSSLAGSGPYRWIVIEIQSGRLVGMSAPFYLPASDGGAVFVDLQVSP